MSRVGDLLGELKELEAGDAGAFPYEDCRTLQRISGASPSLVSDLDTYLSDVAGYRSWGNRIVSWSDAKIAEVERRIAESFFDRFPAHAGLRDVIESGEVVHVQRAIARSDRTRATLCDLLRELRQERAGATKN